ncbi:MAG: protein kinase [Deltaproteobacteria bacterium]|nr:protein kinase [Deltaproteobacteria bacterium]MBP7288462.1 protein kinase [Nannocystaceae bacterium]
MSDPHAGGMWQRPEDLVGTVLNDRFRVLKMIGDGGMGSVYLAEHVTLRKKVALKVLKQELCREQTHVDRFLQEARAASMIAHENVVDIVDFGPVPGGSVFFAMEYLEGEDLAVVLRRERRFPWQRSRELMLQIVRALKAAHARGIIHRDLKPANCFLCKRSDGRDFIKLLDFGIAKVTDESGESGGLTRTGAVFGTAKYMAPEQAMGDPADARTDVYAAAICLYEFLTGQVPFDGDNFMRVLSRHLTEPLTLPSTMAPDAAISPMVEAVIVKALSKRPDDRYQSMTELEQAIMAIGPDGRLLGGHDVGPPLVGRGQTQMADDGPGSTMWMPNAGPPQQAAGRPTSQPPARGGTVMLDPNAAHEQMEPGGTVRLGAEWGTTNTPPPMVHAKPEATFMMDGMGQDVLPQGGGAAVVTRNPPVGTYPPPRGGAAPSTHPGRGPETRPPTFAPDHTRNPDATVFAVEKRSKAGFIALLVVGAIAAVGGGGLFAYAMIGGDDDKPKDKDPVVVADTGKDGSEGTKPSGDPGTTKQPEPSGPKLGEVDPPKQPEPETPKQPEPEIPKQPEPETPKQPEPETPKQPEPQTPKPKNPPPHKDEVKKSLTDEDISKGIGKAVGAVSACKGPLPIKISVRYKITADGRAKVSSVEKSGGGLLSDETKECVKRAVENKAKFPKHEDLKLSSFTF